MFSYYTNSPEVLKKLMFQQLNEEIIKTTLLLVFKVVNPQLITTLLSKIIIEWLLQCFDGNVLGFDKTQIILMWNSYNSVQHYCL